MTHCRATFIFTIIPLYNEGTERIKFICGWIRIGLIILNEPLRDFTHCQNPFFLDLVLCASYLKKKADPVSETSCFKMSEEFQMMDKVKKLGDCDTKNFIR